jgi:hypothetical protein
MFQLLSGCAVREGRTVNEELLDAMTRPPAPLSTVAPDIAPAIAEIVDRALAFPKQDRWPDAEAMREAIAEAYSSLLGIPIGDAPPMTAPSAFRPAALERGHAPSRRPKAPTTDRPVGVSLGPAGRAHGSEHGRIGAAAVGGFVIAGVMAGVIAAGVVGFARSGHTHSVTAAGFSVAPSGVTVALPAPSSAPPPALSPEASVPELDTPVVPKAPAVPAPVWRSRHDQAPPANCVPPYTMDPETGIKRWRVECL